MPDARSIVTAPMPVARGLGFTELATVVAADALVRRAWAVGRAAELVVPTLTGDLGGQYAFEIQLAREGHDRTSLSGQALEVRQASFDEERRVAAAEVFAHLSVTADLGAVTTATPALALAARTAFVKLFEEGVIEAADHVVATCPRCRTAIDAIDTRPAALEGEVLTLGLVAGNGADVMVVLCEPELLPGVVAIAVPEGHPAEGSSVVIPVADREVPVLGDSLHAEPGLVVPAHDGEAHALARAHGLGAVTVLDADGVVAVGGPLIGLGRYAARAAARGLLEAEGVLLAAEPAREDVWRCGCCGTVLVPQLGRHWFLRASDLEVAAADAVRNGLLTFSPADAREGFLASAGERRDWCLSTDVASGVAVPVSTCLECGKLAVDVEESSSCGKCMGVLVRQPHWLDSRFVAAIWAVTRSGWPAGRRTTDAGVAAETLVVASAADLIAWVLPAVALGLRLGGVAPFGAIVVHPWPDPEVSADFVLLADADPRVIRLALVAGTADLDPASAAVAALDLPFADDIDPAEAAEAAAAGVAALDEGSPALAAGLLASVLSTGVPSGAADRLRALALPILGD